MSRVGAGALLGFLASVALAISAQALGAYGFGTTVADSTFGIRWLGRALGLAGLAGLLGAWLLVREASARACWGMALLWAVPLLVAPPVGSRDLFAYAEQGWLVLTGHNPYTTAMGSVGGPYADRVDVWWRGTTTVYPPLALELQRVLVGLAGENTWLGVRLLRLPALVGVGLMGLLAPRVAQFLGHSSRAATWALLLNPVVILHGIGGGHHDLLASGLGVAAVWMALRRRWGWLAGAAVVGLAMAIKQPLGLVVVALAAIGGRTAALHGGSPTQGQPAAGGQVSDARQPGQADDALEPTERAVGTVSVHAADRARWVGVVWRTVVAAVVAAAVFALVTALSGLGWGWLTGSGSPYSVVTVAPSALLADAAARVGFATFTGALRVLGPLGIAVAAVLIAWRAWCDLLDRPVRWLGHALLLVALGAPALQVWYVLWAIGHLAADGVPLRHERAVLAATVVALALCWTVEMVGVPPLWGALGSVAAAMAAAAAGARRAYEAPE